MLVLATISAAPVVALMLLGVVVALFGHASRSRPVIATGLALLFLATAAMVAGALAAYRQDSSDPRPSGGLCPTCSDAPARDR